MQQWSRDEVPEQYRRVQTALENNKLDAMLAISLENVYWLSHSLILTQQSIPDRLAVVVSPLGEEPTFLVCSIEESLARGDSWITDLRTYEEFAQSPIEALAGIMRERGLTRGRVGVEKSYLCARFHEELQGELPDVKWVDISPVFERMRMVKTPREIEMLRHAARNTERAMLRGFQSSRAGDAERACLNRMITSVLDSGAMSAKASFGSGPKSAIAHPFADDTPLAPGALVSVDFTASFQGYCSDLGRTAVVGSSSRRQERIYSVVYDVQRRLIEMIRPGVRACDLYKSACEWLNQAGLHISLPHVGHGIGLVLHEAPLFSAFNQEPLMENMVINLEPLHLTDEGYHVEDTMVVCSEGVEILSDVADHDRIISIAEADTDAGAGT